MTKANSAVVDDPTGYDDLLVSTSLLALQVADNSNVAIFLGNSVADTFDALTYVDVAGGTNLDTSTAGVLKPTTGADTYATSGTLGLVNNLTGYGGYSTRERVPVGVITGDGDRVRVTLRPPTTGNNTPIDDVWIGHAGTGADFDGTQVRVTFSGGATGTTLVAGGALVVSDAIAYAFDDTKDIIVSFDYGATADVRGRTGATGYTSYQKAATSGEAGNTTVSGYSSNAGFLVVLDKLEVRTAIGTPNNMTVLSTILTAPIIPEDISAILLVKEVGGASVAGTDYTLDCSRDGGTTFAAMTLTELFTLPNGLIAVQAAGTDVTGQPSNNTPRWRFKTLNNKNVEFHGVHFIWRLGASP